MSGMRLLIASDIHGSAERALFLKQCLNKHKPDTLVLLGDYLCYGSRSVFRQGPELDIINIYKQYKLPIIAIRGNCDAELDCDLLPFPLVESAWIYEDDLHIFACHGHNMPRSTKQGTIILSGHTHEPRAQTIAGLHYWNPGSLSLPRNGTPPAYALYEHGTFSVIHINGTILMQHKPVNI